MATGCNTATKSQKGAVIGTGGGAVIGAVIGKATGNTARGAVIGAVLGGVGGAVIGRKMDKQAEEMKKVLGDEVVIRVEEGIVINFKAVALAYVCNGAVAETNAELEPSGEAVVHIEIVIHNWAVHS